MNHIATRDPLEGERHAQVLHAHLERSGLGGSIVPGDAYDLIQFWPRARNLHIDAKDFAILGTVETIHDALGGQRAGVVAAVAADERAVLSGMASRVSTYNVRGSSMSTCDVGGAQLHKV